MRVETLIYPDENYIILEGRRARAIQIEPENLIPSRMAFIKVESAHHARLIVGCFNTTHSQTEMTFEETVEKLESINKIVKFLGKSI